jgi:uncharacterized protein (DUF2235 family)
MGDEVGKKIVFCSDGTGNSSAKAEKTNVWRLFQALDQTKTDQIAKYDDGVGTSSNKYLAAIGGAFGWGLKRNVLDLYKFVCRNWRAGDDIYGFGFSRGSFTIRVLVDFIATEGLVTFRSEAELDRNAADAYRSYRSKNFPSWSPLVLLMRRLRDALLWAKGRIKGYRTYKEIVEEIKAAGKADIRIKFLGLWDTVEAYGIPIDELKRGIDWVLWPMLFGDLVLSPRVDRACHALSLDDERTTFHPLLWDEVAEADMVAKGKVAPGRITQVWFAGVHSNVGGGYPEDQLSFVPLGWIMSEAIANGLDLDKEAVEQVEAAKSPYARLYDSRAGAGAYYRYAPRQIWVRRDGQDNPILPIVHGSVVMRMAYGSDRYSPISLPYEFWVLAPDGELLPMEGAPLSLKFDATKKQVASTRPVIKTSAVITAEKDQLIAAIKVLSRPDRQAIRLVWDTVFWRQCLYSFTAGLTAILAVYPWLGGTLTDAAHRLLWLLSFIGPDLDTRWQGGLDRLDLGARGPITSLVDAMSGFIPSYAGRWTNAFEDHPIEFAVIVAGIFVGLIGSSILQERIHDRAHLAWHKDEKGDYSEWLSESQKGWRNGMLVALAIAIIFLVLALWLATSQLLAPEFGIVVVALFALLTLQHVGARQVAPSKTTPIKSTIALSAARFLRNNSLWRAVHKWVFKRAVPIAFALLLVAAGGLVLNRTLFDGASAAGYFCTGSRDANARLKEAAAGSKEIEVIGSKDGFATDQMCWASGLLLVKGRHYRITLATPGDWFDQAIRADVAGFSADSNLLLLSAAPLKRWWGQNWFKPIARIGLLGNDEYVLEPFDPFEPYNYSDPSCRVLKQATNGDWVRAKVGHDVAQGLLTCAPTPDDRRTVTTEIQARSSGELFLYVNDAVLMLPGLSDLFISNNSGTGRVTVERVTAAVP